MNTKLHAMTDSVGPPIRFLITVGQVSDCVGARALSGSLPAGDWLIADRGCDADWFRKALQDRGDTPLYPGADVSRQSRPVRQATPQAAKPHRAHVRSPEGPPADRHPLRLRPEGRPVRRPAGRTRDLLALTINEAGA